MCPMARWRHPSESNSLAEPGRPLATDRGLSVQCAHCGGAARPRRRCGGARDGWTMAMAEHFAQPVPLQSTRRCGGHCRWAFVAWTSARGTAWVVCPVSGLGCGPQPVRQGRFGQPSGDGSGSGALRSLWLVCDQPTNYRLLQRRSPAVRPEPIQNPSNDPRGWFGSCVAHLIPRKNQPVLLDASAAVKDGLTLMWWVHSDGIRNTHRSYSIVQDTGLSERVRFLVN